MERVTGGQLAIARLTAGRELRLTPEQAKTTIDSAHMSERLRRQLWNQWRSGVPGARFSVYALAIRLGIK